MDPVTITNLVASCLVLFIQVAKIVKKGGFYSSCCVINTRKQEVIEMEEVPHKKTKKVVHQKE